MEFSLLALPLSLSPTPGFSLNTSLAMSLALLCGKAGESLHTAEDRATLQRPAGLIVNSRHGAGSVTEGASGDLWGRRKAEDRKATFTTHHLC